MNSLRSLLLVTVFLAPLAAGANGLALEGAEAEDFLRRAKVIKREGIAVGVTRPQRLTLQLGDVTARAVWKTYDERKAVKHFRDGTFEVGFVDSWTYEVAGYELDKLLGLGMVPPTIARRLHGRIGALGLWVEDAMTESERIASGRRAPDVETWNQQLYSVRLFHNLIYDTDSRNTGNILCDSSGRVFLIDNSRAFRTWNRLLAEEDLTRFSRSLLAAMRRLDARILRQKLGRWLSKRHIEALLVRRDLILELAERRVAERGEDRVLYP